MAYNDYDEPRDDRRFIPGWAEGGLYFVSDLASSSRTFHKSLDEAWEVAAEKNRVCAAARHVSVPLVAKVCGDWIDLKVRP